MGLFFWICGLVSSIFILVSKILWISFQYFIGLVSKILWDQFLGFCEILAVIFRLVLKISSDQFLGFCGLVSSILWISFQYFVDQFLGLASLAIRSETELTFLFEPEAAAKCGLLKETEKVNRVEIFFCGRRPFSFLCNCVCVPYFHWEIQSKMQVASVLHVL